MRHFITQTKSLKSRLTTVYLIGFIGLSLMLQTSEGFANKTKTKYNARYYGAQLCSSPKYTCVIAKSGDTWEKLFPDADIRDVVKRVNRTNMRIRYGMPIAIPKNLKNVSIWDVSPMPHHIKKTGKKIIIVNQNKYAWGAYNAEGELQWWGPISPGKAYCRDVKRACNTKAGMFYIFNREGKECESSKFPVGRGGAQMPYCMFFYKGYALHGSPMVPGYRDSHGCVRLFLEDARWLNEKFIEMPSEKNNYQGTQVIIQEMTDKT